MATTDYQEPSRSSAAWLYVPIILILFLGGALSVGMYFYADTQLTVAEALAAGFGSLAAIIGAIFATVIAVILSLLGALIALVTAGGAVAMTLFIIASPVIAIILIALLMRRPKSDCPNPAAHE